VYSSNGTRHKCNQRDAPTSPLVSRCFIDDLRSLAYVAFTDGTKMIVRSTAMKHNARPQDNQQGLRVASR
jgi:hypothetical protein